MRSKSAKMCQGTAKEDCPASDKMKDPSVLSRDEEVSKKTGVKIESDALILCPDATSQDSTQSDKKRYFDFW